MEIKKKVWPQYFELIKSGKKKFEVRVADFEVKEGDILILEEWDPETKEYTGRSLTKKVGYTLKFSLDSFGQKELIEEKGLIVISLDDL
jgi:ASC-1-like (ASCH) protein